MIATANSWGISIIRSSCCRPAKHKFSIALDIIICPAFFKQGAVAPLNINFFRKKTKALAFVFLSLYLMSVAVLVVASHVILSFETPRAFAMARTGKYVRLFSIIAGLSSATASPFTVI